MKYLILIGWKYQFKKSHEMKQGKDIDFNISKNTIKK